MKVLIITATYIEAQEIIRKIECVKKSDFFYSSEKYLTDILVSGVGIPATIFSMFTSCEIRQYDFIINLGIAGSFNPEIKIGDTVNIHSDCFADIGLENDGKFQQIFSSQFNKQFSNLINNGHIYNTSDYPNFFHNLNKVKAASVNIPEKIKGDKYEIETMEGAAFMLVCKYFKKNFIQVRSISNIIGHTEKQNWEVKKAIEKYSNLVIDFLSNINKNNTVI